MRIVFFAMMSWMWFCASLAKANCVTAVSGVAGTPSKIFVVDTNTFYAEPDAISLLSDQHVVVPRTVLEELDRHKVKPDDLGQLARRISAGIYSLLEPHETAIGIPLAGARGDLSFAEVTDDFKLPAGFDRAKADHRIVGLALQLQRANQHKKVTLITRDNNAAVLAKSVGINADRLKVKVDPDAVRDVMSGPVFLDISSEQMYQVRGEIRVSIPAEEFEKFGFSVNAVHENQFVIFREVGTSNAAGEFNLKAALPLVWRYVLDKGGHGYFLSVRQRVKPEQLEILPRNLEQILVYDLLLDPRIKLVSLTGTAGTGKTLVTMAAGLSQSQLFRDNSPFETIIVTRPNQVTGRDIGFLPGTIEEKMNPFLGPFEDNIAVLIEAMRKKHGVSGLNSVARAFVETNNPVPTRLTADDFLSPAISVKEVIYRLKQSDYFNVQPIAYSRGRSFRKTFMVIDEAQNLSPLEAKTILTRAGEGTKVVLLGDLDQIDATSLNRSSNGLIIAASRFRGKHLAGHVHLTMGERSELATMASEIMHH